MDKDKWRISGTTKVDSLIIHFEPVEAVELLLPASTAASCYDYARSSSMHTFYNEKNALQFHLRPIQEAGSDAYASWQSLLYCSLLSSY